MRRVTTDEGVYGLARGVLIACGLVVGLTALAVVGMGVWGRLAPPPPPAYLVGEQVDVPASVWQDARSTLIIFARSNCPRCKEAQGFLTELVARAQGVDGVRAVMLTGGWDLSDEESFAAALGLRAEDVLRLPAGLRVARVPTVLLIARDGTIRMVSEDLPDEAERGGVVRAFDQLLIEPARP